MDGNVSAPSYIECATYEVHIKNDILPTLLDIELCYKPCPPHSSRTLFVTIVLAQKAHKSVVLDLIYFFLSFLFFSIFSSLFPSSNPRRTPLPLPWSVLDTQPFVPFFSAFIGIYSPSCPFLSCLLLPIGSPLGANCMKLGTNKGFFNPSPPPLLSLVLFAP